MCWKFNFLFKLKIQFSACSSLYPCPSCMILHCLLALTFDLSMWLLLDQQEIDTCDTQLKMLAQLVLLIGVLPLHHENMPRLAFCRLNRTEIRIRLPQSSWLRQLMARRVLNIWSNPTRSAKTNLGQLHSRASWKMCFYLDATKFFWWMNSIAWQ